MELSPGKSPRRITASREVSRLEEIFREKEVKRFCSNEKRKKRTPSYLVPCCASNRRRPRKRPSSAQSPRSCRPSRPRAARSSPRDLCEPAGPSFNWRLIRVSNLKSEKMNKQKYLNVGEIGHPLADLPGERENVARSDRVHVPYPLRLADDHVGQRRAAVASNSGFQVSATPQVIPAKFPRILRS